MIELLCVLSSVDALARAASVEAMETDIKTGLIIGAVEASGAILAVDGF
jgi:hypothetical protein